jgi:cell shape-determining protein MreC
MPRTRKKQVRTRLLLALAGVSLAVMIMPRQLTGRLINLVQVLVPFQFAAEQAADAAGALLPAGGEALTREAYDALQRENAAMRHQLLALSGHIDALERERTQLAAIRHRGLAGGRLISARVVARDPLPWRQSRLIDSGTLAGVRRHAAVTSHYFSITPDRLGVIRDGLAVLSSEVLVGFIEQAGTHAARVRLLTDAETRMSVLIGRQQGDAYVPLDKEFWLAGTGGPLLQIRAVDHRYVTLEAIRLGDVVLTSSYDEHLPASLTVGTVTDLRQDPDNALLYVLEVTPALAASEIRHVFVVDPLGGASAGGAEG